MNNTNCRARCPHRAARRILSLILSLAMLLSITAGLDFSAYALSSSGSCGENVTYTFDSETGLLTISGSGAMTNYSSFGSPFSFQSGIKTIVINNGVTSICNYAFCFCTGLTSITIPDSVTSIGSSAFIRCASLTSITVDSNNTVYDSRCISPAITTIDGGTQQIKIMEFKSESKQ